MCGARRRMWKRCFDVNQPTKATAANTSKPKAKTATYPALPKSTDGYRSATSTVILLLRIAILGAVHLNEMV